MYEQVRQGAHASKVQQADWRAGRKGGVNANVAVSSAADNRSAAFTDVQLRSDAGATPADSFGSAAASSAVPAATSNGAAAPSGDRSSGTNSNATSSGANGASAKTQTGAAAVGAGAGATARDANGAAVPAANGVNDWSKAQELALIKAIKAIGKDVNDRCATRDSRIVLA